MPDYPLFMINNEKNELDAKELNTFCVIDRALYEMHMKEELN